MKDGEVLRVKPDMNDTSEINASEHIFSDEERKILIELICEKQTQKIIKDPMCYTLHKYQVLEKLKVKIKDM